MAFENRQFQKKEAVLFGDSYLFAKI